jgi:flagellar biosynthesis/type III secretory pathway M-ring protein FliF/YscJ
MPLQSPVNVARAQVEELVDRDADRVAQQVRAWMSEE